MDVSEENIEVDVTNEFSTDMVSNSRQSLIEWVQNAGRNLGFVIVMKMSEIGGFGRRHKLLLQCKHGGTYKSKKTSTMLVGTKEMECPFRVKGLKLNTYDDWMNLVKPLNILYTLKNRDPNSMSTINIIYNARQKFRTAEKVGSLKLLRAFQYVLLMDATCKTNTFRISLFEIVGVISTKMTSCIVFVFLQSKKEDNYTWALNCLRSTMDEYTTPRVIVTDRDLTLMRSCAQVFLKAMKLLCTWHIDRVVIANYKKSFQDKQSWDAFYSMWHTLLESETKNAYLYNLSALEVNLQKYLKVVNCIKDEWLTPYKEMFISAWRDTYMQFGNVTTNRVESQHSKLKRYLGTSQSDLELAVSSIHQLLQDDDIDCSVELQIFIEQFKHQSRLDKVSLLRKLRELINPSITTLLQLVVKTNIHGRPSSKKKVHRSTHGNPSAFEFVQHDLNHSQEPSRHSCSSEPGRHSCSSLYSTPPLPTQTISISSLVNHEQVYLSQFPPTLHPYIMFVKDVRADENCGFQAIVGLLGFDEDAWMHVHQNLIVELRTFWTEHADIFGDYYRACSIYNSLNF
ncbi:uncharacterized protein LOC119999129 [Tripterygium wilfordii]|uniref:uncharacterized protein LOC119999129 n=1 Tax=Tripterygium wilfordii TaxID=458696 RepID=UPI0018F8601E|nr:uncharacterized protein LOC119999129 [Tripterygium wilfordii]